MISPFDFQPRTRVLFGAGKFAKLGELARFSFSARYSSQIAG
jgi:hypothetical protein